MTLGHKNSPMDARGDQPAPGAALRVLFVGPDADDAARVAGALGQGPDAATVLHAPKVADARVHLAEGDLDVVLVDMRVLESLNEVRKIVTSATRLPFIVLLDEGDVVDLEHAISARAAGFYYKQQLSPVLVQRALRQAVQQVPV